VTLAARWIKHFGKVLAIFLVAELPSKKCFGTQEVIRRTQEVIRFLSTVLSQRQAK
jgi:hypothetical protein